MTPIQPHETGALDHAGMRLPRGATARAVWRLLRGPLKLKRISAITSKARGLSPGVRSVLKVRAIQSLSIALDCAVQAGRAGRPLTANLFVEALAERWSEVYRRTRDTWGTGRLADFKPETVVAIREELIGSGVALHKLWTVARGGVQGLYETSAPIKNRGRLVSLTDGEDRPLPLLAQFDELLDADPRYQRDTARGPRLLMARDAMPPRKIAQRVAGERPYDIMHIGPGTEETLQRLEAALVFLDVRALLSDIAAGEAKLQALQWPAMLREWKWVVLPAALARADLDVPSKAPKRGPVEVRYWNDVQRRLTWKFRQAASKAAWAEYLAAGGRQSERARYNALKGRLAAMKAIQDQVRDQLGRHGVAGELMNSSSVAIKSGFYKHRTRRFQAVNVWPPEASSGEELIVELPADARDYVFRELGDRPTRLSIPQRIRWFHVVKDGQVEALTGDDISGSQAQILAVLMGLPGIETQLRELPFKTLVAGSAKALHRNGMLRLPDELHDNDDLLEENAKGGMKRLYGASLRSIAEKARRDPDRFGPGLDVQTLQVLFDETPILKQLGVYLDVCETLGKAACVKDPTAGVTVVDPLDGASFTWNPPLRRKVQIRSGAFKLYCYPPVGVGDGGYMVDTAKLSRRIAPGLVQMLDALFAAEVVAALNDGGVRDVVAIHDAFLVPAGRYELLQAAFERATRAWFPKLDRVYAVFERYLPPNHEHGQLVREWRATWEQRLAACEAGRGEWPEFRTKHEGPHFR
jgi:hypothetical protein